MNIASRIIIIEEVVVYCPNCRAEYRAGFTRCSDCRVDLVTGSPEPELPDPAVIEKRATYQRYAIGCACVGVVLNLAAIFIFGMRVASVVTISGAWVSIGAKLCYAFAGALLGLSKGYSEVTGIPGFLFGFLGFAVIGLLPAKPVPSAGGSPGRNQSP